jgi:hypothetical protein
MLNKKPPDKEFYKSNKVSLKHILKNPEINLEKIMDATFRTNKIIIHTLQFMKLYLIDYYDKNKSLFFIDDVFINSCMKILCNETKTGRPPKKEVKELKDKLTSFYNIHYKPFMLDETLEYTYLNTVLDYLTKDIITMYENNIKLHYVEYIERFVNVIWKKKYIIDKIRKLNITQKEKEDRINKLCSQLRKIKKDILNIENNKYKSYSFYHQWIDGIKKHIIPNKDKFNKDNLYYDLQCNPQDYLPCMVFMMKEIEKEGLFINNVFPLRSDIIVKHIPIDTTTLVHLLMRKDIGNKSDYLFNGNLKRNEDKIWKFFLEQKENVLRKIIILFII